MICLALILQYAGSFSAFSGEEPCIYMYIYAKVQCTMYIITMLCVRSLVMKTPLMGHSSAPYKESVKRVHIQMPFHAVGHSWRLICS